MGSRSKRARPARRRRPDDTGSSASTTEKARGIGRAPPEHLPGRASQQSARSGGPRNHPAPPPPPAGESRARPRRSDATRRPAGPSAARLPSWRRQRRANREIRRRSAYTCGWRRPACPLCRRRAELHQHAVDRHLEVGALRQRRQRRNRRVEAAAVDLDRRDAQLGHPAVEAVGVRATISSSCFSASAMRPLSPSRLAALSRASRPALVDGKAAGRLFVLLQRGVASRRFGLERVGRRRRDRRRLAGTAPAAASSAARWPSAGLGQQRRRLFEPAVLPPPVAGGEQRDDRDDTEPPARWCGCSAPTPHRHVRPGAISLSFR